MNGIADKLEALAAQLKSNPDAHVVANIAEALDGIAAQLKVNVSVGGATVEQSAGKVGE